MHIHSIIKVSCYTHIYERDRYTQKDAFDRIIDYTDSFAGRMLGRRSQRVLGGGMLAAGSYLVVEGLWNHDFEHIVGGIGMTCIGGFTTLYANSELRQLSENSSQSQP